MTIEEADRVGIAANERTRHFRVDDGKANMARPPECLAVWRRLESVDLGNGALGVAGDNVQVAVAWRLPGPLEKVTERHLCEVQQEMGDREFGVAAQSRAPPCRRKNMSTITVCCRRTWRSSTPSSSRSSRSDRSVVPGSHRWIELATN